MTDIQDRWTKAAAELLVGRRIVSVDYMTDDDANEAVRFSWCHLTPEVDWQRLAHRIRELMS